jgi:hypothetical protein
MGQYGHLKLRALLLHILAMLPRHRTNLRGGPCK